MRFEIIEYDNKTHRDQVGSLWKVVFGYTACHNDPEIVITQKVDFKDGLFFVAVDERDVIGTVMAGYDGHRGWIYALAVAASHRKKGVGSALLAFAEKALADKGCLKINLQIMEGNEPVESFYLSNGYQTEKRISMGKPLTQV